MVKLHGSRPPAVAGLFYPSDPGELNDVVSRMLNEARQKSSGELSELHRTRRFPRALIAPHAGYVYSGPVAASAYVYLEAASGAVDKVAIFGPSHRVPVRGLALCSAATLAMPGFEMRADEEALEVLEDSRAAVFADEAHSNEHSIEVHLPFVRSVLGDVEVAAVAVGESSPEEVGRAIELLLENPRRSFVISSDLSHYLDYETAVRVDSITARAISGLRYEEIGYEQACGRNCVRGLLWLARKRGMHSQLLDLRNSGDTAGSKDSVVGYPAFAFWDDQT
jgi:AmmeMemoRadiSam system protein B